MAAPKQLVVAGWPKGMNNIAPDYAMPEGTARNLVNVDVFTDGKLRRRKGFASVYSSATTHSLWGNEDITLFVEGTNLKALSDSTGIWTATTLVGGLSPANKCYYVEVNNEVYFSDGTTKGKVVNGVAKRWGVEVPNIYPTLSTGAGAMPAGVYQINCTFVTATGEESGANLGVSISVPANGSIAISNIPQPTSSEVYRIRIYATPQNGDVFYRLIDLPVGTLTHTVYSTMGTAAMQTQFLQDMPACTHLEYFNGRIFGVYNDNTVVYTDPFAYGLCNLNQNFLMFSDKVTVIKAVIDGLYIVADKTYFVTFDESGAPTQRVVLPYGAIEDTDGKIPNTINVFWFSVRGAVVAGNGGEIKNVMEESVAVDEFLNGAAIYREQDGLKQIVSSLNGRGQVSALGATDYVEAEIIRGSR